MEQCIQHRDFADKTDKMLVVLEEIKSVIVGDIKNPNNLGVMSRVANLEIKIESLEKAKNSIVNVAFKVLASLAVGGVTIKTLLDSIVK